MKILLAVDGSAYSTRATSFVVKLAASLSSPPMVSLFYADPPLRGNVASRLAPEMIEKYHADNQEEALKAARTTLKKAQIVSKEVRRIAEPAKAIAQYAEKGSYDMIVMGTHGRGAIGGLLLGSVTRKVLSQCDIPVTVVR